MKSFQRAIGFLIHINQVYLIKQEKKKIKILKVGRRNFKKKE
jgi:hypothetical protein